MKPFGAALEATTRELSHVLPAYGFPAAHVRLTSPHGFRRQWRRHASWRTDVVELPYRRGGELAVFVSFSIQFPGVDDRHGQPAEFDGWGLDIPHVPIMFAALRARRYGRVVARLVKRQLYWFDQFRTPEDCLVRVHAENRNGPRKGRTLDEMIRHLEARRK